MQGPSKTAHLSVEAIDESREPLDGVEALVHGAGLIRRFAGDREGRLDLELPVGTYDITFSREDFYDLALIGVDVDSPDPAAEPSSPASLRVMMVRNLVFEIDLKVIGPRYVDPPPLTIAFQPVPPAVADQPARGTVRLTNIGTEPLMLPLSRDFRHIPGKTMTLRIVLQIEGLNATFDEPFVCEPPDGCHQLDPGEAVDLPIYLKSRQSYWKGTGEPITWGGSGEFVARVGVYLAYPWDEATDGRATKTRFVWNEFHLPVKQQ